MAHHYCIRNQRSHLDLSASGRRTGRGGRESWGRCRRTSRRERGREWECYHQISILQTASSSSSSALNRSLHSSHPSLPLPLSQMPARLQRRWPLPVMECLPVECQLFPSFPSFALSLSFSGELFPSNNGKRKHKSRLGRGWGVTAGGATEAAKDRAGGKGRDG